MKAKALFGSLVAFAVCSFGASAPAQTEHAAPTAFRLAEEGNRHVPVPARDKIVQIRSERSLTGLQPEVWYVVYYDPDAALRATEVKFGGDRVLDVRRPFRLLEPMLGQHRPLDTELLRVDSDEALRLALESPALRDVDIRSVEMKLERPGFGAFDGRPIWVVKLWAARPIPPMRQVEIGEVIISAEDAAVLRTDLDLGRVR